MSGRSHANEGISVGGTDLLPKAIGSGVDLQGYKVRDTDEVKE
jgi:hypothetical protein